MGLILLLTSLASGEDDLAAKSQRARQAMIEKRFEEAVDLYTELVNSLPSNPGMQMNLGLALHSAGRYREAIARFTTASKLQPSLAQAKLLTGVAYLKLGEPAHAIAPLSDAVKAGPTDPIARLELADALLSTGRFEDAARHFGKLTELDSRDARGWQGLGLSYLGLGRRAFEALEKVAPDSAYVLALLANSRAQQRQDRSAFALYKQALTQDAGLRGVHAGLAEIYRRAGHADWAGVEEERERALPALDCSIVSAECAFLAGRYEQVIAVVGDSLQTLYWKARSYSALALAALSRLAQLPPSPQIHELMAEALRVQGQHGEAAKELREALQVEPGNSRLTTRLAGELWRNRDFDAAAPLLEKLVAANPKSAELNFQMGDLLLQQEQPEKALPWLKSAVKFNPRLLPARAALARCYMRLDRAAEAIEHFEAALPIDDDGSLHFQLARAYEHVGAAVKAKQVLRQFEAISQASATKRKRAEDERQITAP